VVLYFIGDIADLAVESVSNANCISTLPVTIVTTLGLPGGVRRVAWCFDIKCGLGCNYMHLIEVGGQGSHYADW